MPRLEPARVSAIGRGGPAMRERVKSEQPERQLFLRERYLPAQELTVREHAKIERITGSITLELSQGTVVAVTVQARVKLAPSLQEFDSTPQ